MSSAFKLIDFRAKITSLNSRGGRTKRNRSIAEVGKLNNYLLESELVVELRELLIGFLLCTNSLALYSSLAIV